MKANITTGKVKITSLSHSLSESNLSYPKSIEERNEFPLKKLNKTDLFLQSSYSVTSLCFCELSYSLEHLYSHFGDSKLFTLATSQCLCFPI